DGAPRCVDAGLRGRPMPPARRTLTEYPRALQGRPTSNPGDEDPIVAARIPLTLACGDYEIIRPLKEGTVRPDGIDLTILTAMDSTTRHWRYLRGREFDAGEVSCSSYTVARDQGLTDTAIPVFLHL